MSALMVLEASKGDEVAAAQRLDAIHGLPVLHIGDDAGRMAELLVVEKAIPAECAEDALHVAMATRNGMDFVVTWNFTHINNARATAPCWSLAPLTQ
ncbi:MAG: hypothetical protein HWD57_15335 [Candidatus Accumulibacter cognatus]|uniref:PIN domain-containing protein n=1 Tax=Candidatus Accumulibacter cognatus TaxID=2954383 RepID=A0A7D5NDG7_9PROT|nr:MAG: hypothetical protein HWD57_15335 [Candidatus Accumulibacter cognatus]